MSEYRAPLRDMHFLLHEVFAMPSLWASLPALQETADADTAEAILAEAAKICAEVLAPLNAEADEFGVQIKDGEVCVTPAFKEAYRLYVEGGWTGLAGDPEFGGMGMPKTLSAQVEEMLQASGMAFGLAPMLTAGAALAIKSHGSDAIKALYLPRLYSGEWTGAMDLTEAHAGTDLGLIRTQAVDRGDGTYGITGSKIFITWGDHDVAPNIVHLVLARLHDAPPGPKGISMFLVPKFIPDAEGNPGQRNAVSCGSLEKKMGIHGSPTCLLNYDDATGWLVGELNQGLAAMFTMMNYERLGVGIQALGTAHRSYLQAADYARERLQSRSPLGKQCPQQIADPLLVHPDVRRMLLTMRAHIEGSRAFSTYVGQWLDIARFSDDSTARAHAENMVALLTPVAKAVMSDLAFEACVLGQQVLGGHGYIREWGQEQLVRDVRVTQIYEGTNGIQAMDLIGRKLIGSQGQLPALLLAEARLFASDHATSAGMDEFLPPLQYALDLLERTSAAMVATAQDDACAAGAAAYDYLKLVGLTAYAYLWARMAATALPQLNGDDGDFYADKLSVARFFFQRQLPQVQSLVAAIDAGSASLMAIPAERF